MEILAYEELSLGHDAAAEAMASRCVNARPESKATVASAWRSFVAADCLAFKGYVDGDYSELLRSASTLSEQDRALAASWNISFIAAGPLLTHDLDGVVSDTWFAALEAASDRPGSKANLAN